MAICYKDKTFCRSDCARRDCYRYLSNEEIERSCSFGLPIAGRDFSDDCPDYLAPHHRVVQMRESRRIGDE